MGARGISPLASIGARNPLQGLSPGTQIELRTDGKWMYILDAKKKEAKYSIDEVTPARRLQRDRAKTICFWPTSSYLVPTLRMRRLQRQPHRAVWNGSVLGVSLDWHGAYRRSVGIPGAMEQKTRLRNQESSSIASDELRRGRSCPRWTASGTEKA